MDRRGRYGTRVICAVTQETQCSKYVPGVLSLIMGPDGIYFPVVGRMLGSDVRAGLALLWEKFRAEWRASDHKLSPQHETPTPPSHHRLSITGGKGQPTIRTNWKTSASISPSTLGVRDAVLVQYINGKWRSALSWLILFNADFWRFWRWR